MNVHFALGDTLAHIGPLWLSAPKTGLRHKGWLWHALGESSSVRKKKGSGQCSQREGCSSKRASWESFLELMGLKSREEGELGETFPLLSRLPELTYSGE